MTTKLPMSASDLQRQRKDAEKARDILLSIKLSLGQEPSRGR